MWLAVTILNNIGLDHFSLLSLELHKLFWKKYSWSLKSSKAYENQNQPKLSKNLGTSSPDLEKRKMEELIHFSEHALTQ